MPSDITQAENRNELLRQVLIASGFAGPLFGAEPRRMSQADYTSLLDT